MLRVAFVLGQYPAEQRKLRVDAAMSYATPDLEVGILEVPLAPFDGVQAAEIEQAAPHFHAAFCRAEDEGYDAVVPLGMLDFGINGGRCLVDIPVIAPFEASLHIAAQLGDRLGIVAYTDEAITKARPLARYYGMEARIAGYDSTKVVLRNMGDSKQQLIDSFVAASRRLIDNHGADVIIPGGITQCPIHIKPDWLSKELGVPVVEGIGAPIRMAGMMAGLGYRHSRIRWPKSTSRPKY